MTWSILRSYRTRIKHANHFNTDVVYIYKNIICSEAYSDTDTNGYIKRPSFIAEFFSTVNYVIDISSGSAAVYFDISRSRIKTQICIGRANVKDRDFPFNWIGFLYGKPYRRPHVGVCHTSFTLMNTHSYISRYTILWFPTHLSILFAWQSKVVAPVVEFLSHFCIIPIYCWTFSRSEYLWNDVPLDVQQPIIK